MLAPDQVQRYVRHILVPEVGRAGQERWLEARLTVAGSGSALDAAVELVTAAGVRIDRAEGGTLSQLGELLVGETAFADRRLGCEQCLPAFFAARPAPAADEVPTVAFAAGAAAAAEALLQLLDPERPPIAMVFTPAPRRVSVEHRSCACPR